MDRRAFVAELITSLPPTTVCVSGLGSASYDLCAAGDRDLNFYLWGAMGLAVPVGLGLALAQPKRPVVVITGDGEHLMGIGSLATITASGPANLTVVVLDNGHFGETGMQHSHTSLGTDLAAVARGFGIRTVHRITGLDGVPTLATTCASMAGPAFAHVLISADAPPRVMPNRDGSYITNRLRLALGFQPF